MYIIILNCKNCNMLYTTTYINPSHYCYNCCFLKKIFIVVIKD